MTHQAIEQNETIERYARGRLSAEDKSSFEEHFFSCDQCFEKVQTIERFIAGTRYAAQTGLLKNDAAERVEQSGFFQRIGWLKPAFALAAGVALLLGVAAAWLWLYQAPRLRDELARERARSEQINADFQGAKENFSQAEEQLRLEREERARLETRLQQSQPAAGLVASLEANLPLVMLEATRGGETPELLIPRTSQNVALWIESVSAQSRTFRLEIYSAEGRLLQTIAGVKRNPYGALAISLPAKILQTGPYLVKLWGVDSGQVTPAGEYRLRVRKQ